MPMVLRDPFGATRPTSPVRDDLPNACGGWTAIENRLHRAFHARSASSVVVFVLGGVVAAAFLSAFDIASRLEQTSDSVQGLVEGYAIARGNVLLSGWHLPLDNYYFTDALPYAAFELIAGAQPILLALVPALTYALFFCAGLALCLKPGQSLGRNVEAASAAALMLAPSGWIGSWNPLLMSNMHFGTAVCALVVLALCARIAKSASRSRALDGWCAAFVVLAVATVASDPFSLVFAFGPALVLLSGEMLLHGRKQREHIVLVALAGAVVAGLALPVLIARASGFATEDNVVTAVASPALLLRNAAVLAGGILKLAGLNASHLTFEALALLTLRALVLVIATVAVLQAARGLPRSDRAPLFDRLLCAGMLSLLAACLLSTQFGKGIGTQNPWAGGPPMRYAMPLVMFAAVLGARRIPALFPVLRDERMRFLGRGGLVLLAVAALSAGTLSTLGRPHWIANNPPTQAAQWLSQHRLARGDADYWSANLLAAMSYETLDLRSVVPDDGKVVPYTLSADQSAHRGPPRFLIWHVGTPSGMTFADARATYQVCQVFVVAGYRIALLAEPEHTCPKDPVDQSANGTSA